MFFKFLIRFLGLPGSWSWAVRQMERGKIVRPGNATGTVRYRLDNEKQGRIEWAFPRRDDTYGEEAQWESANIFTSNFINTNWKIV